jgi:hypothetical protein
MKRPIAVTLLAIVAAIAGLIAVVDVARYLGFAPMASFGALDFYGVSIFGAILAAVVAFIWFSTARQLWNLDPRGWTFVLMISILYLIFAIVGGIGNNWGDVMPAIVISGLALILAILPGTKAAFGQ